MKKYYIIFSLLTLQLFSATFRLGVPEPVFNLPQFGILSNLLVTSFKSLNHEIEFVPLPTLRALDMVDKDEIDGVFPLPLTSITGYKNILAVNERLGGMTISAFTSPESPQVKTWEDLKDKKIGYLLGSTFIEKKLNESSIDKKNITNSKDFKALMKMLETSRVDVILMDSVAFRTTKSKNIKVVENLIISTEAFLFLNKKHKNLKVPLEKEIKKYKTKNPGVF